MSKETENRPQPESSHEETTNQENTQSQTIEITPEQQRIHQKEMQRQFNMFKKLYKVKPKSELVAIIWEQGLAYHDLQQIAKELHQELLELKEKPSEQN